MGVGMEMEKQSEIDVQMEKETQIEVKMLEETEIDVQSGESVVGDEVVKTVGVEKQNQTEIGHKELQCID